MWVRIAWQAGRPPCSGPPMMYFAAAPVSSLTFLHVLKNGRARQGIVFIVETVLNFGVFIDLE